MTGNVGGGIDTVGSGDQMTREYVLRNIARSVCYGERQAYEQQGVEGVDRRRRYDLSIHREEILEIQRKSTLPPWKRVSGGIRSHNNMSFVGGESLRRLIVRIQWVQERGAISVSRSENDDLDVESLCTIFKLHR